MRKFNTSKDNQESSPTNYNQYKQNDYQYFNYQRNQINIPQNKQPINQNLQTDYLGYFESGQLNALNQNRTINYKRIWITPLDYLIIIIGLIGIAASIWPPIICICLLILRNLGIVNPITIRINDKKIKITKDDYARLEHRKPMLEQKPNTISKFDVQLSKDLSICQNSSFVNGTKMQQLYDNRIIFDRDNPIYYYLQGVSFEPQFKEEYVTSTNGHTKDNRKTITKRKGKAGRVATGGILGKMVGGNTGALVGTAAGLSSGGKTTTKNSGGEQYNEQTVTSTRQIEVTSHAYITLYNINTQQFGQVVVLAKTADFVILKKFKIYHVENNQVISNNPISHENLEILKQLAQLRDQGVISPEEFETKKQQLL